MTVKCAVCGREIAFEEDMFSVETTQETICQRDGCLEAHIMENITSTEIDECFNDVDFKVEKERFRQGGLKGLTEENKKILIEWYMDNFVRDCFNSEPDEKTLQEWEKDAEYEFSLYYRR